MQMLFVRTTFQVRRQWDVAVLLGGLTLASGCGLDPYHWRVRDPGMVELTRTVGLEKPPGQPVLATEQGATTVYVPYSYWPRGRALPASACEEGPTPSSRAISELTGLAFGCQGTTVAQRHPDGTLDLDSSRGFERLVGVDGNVLPKLWRHDCDTESGQCWARLTVRTDAKTDLFLLLSTPRRNLSQVMRIQQRNPLLGGLLVGMGVLWAGLEREQSRSRPTNQLCQPVCPLVSLCSQSRSVAVCSVPVSGPSHAPSEKSRSPCRRKPRPESPKACHRAHRQRSFPRTSQR